MATVRVLASAESSAWPPPRPIDGAELPMFPVLSVLSDGQRWIDAVSHATQTPRDLASMVALGALAAAVRGWADVEVREGWREPLTLFTAIVLPSGEGKSPVMTRAVAPLRAVELEIAKANRDPVAQGQAVYRAAQERLRLAEREAAKPNGVDRLVAEDAVRRAASELAALDYPEIPRILVDDATPEALVGLLVVHQACAVMSAEGGLFDTLGGRYADGVANLDGVLKAWSGEPIHVDRRVRAAEHVERPILALCLAIQPQVIEGLRDNGVMRGRGLAARFLYSLPTTMLGNRELDPAPVPADIEAAWSRRIRELARPSDRTDTTRAVLGLSVEATAALTEFRASLEPRLHPATGDLFEISDWAGKLPGNVARIAGLLHLGSHGWAGVGVPVSAQTMGAAVEIGRYLIPHAQAAMPAPGRDPSRALGVLRWLSGRSVREVSVREVQHGLSGPRFPDSATVSGSLEMLEDHGYLRRLPQPPPNPRGGQPPSPRFEVHPLLQSGRRPLAPRRL